MSAAQATSLSTSRSRRAARRPNWPAVPLLTCRMMREVEDRIERKLYRQGKIRGRRLRGARAGGHSGGHRAARRARRRAVPLPPRHGRVLHSRRPPAAGLRPVHGPRGRAHARPRRQHAHGRHEAEHRGHHQRHGGLRAGGRRRRPGAQVPGHAQRGLVLLRRRRHQPRRLARGHQLGRRAEAARGAGLQQQPVRLLDAARKADGAAPTWPTAGRPTASRPRSWTATTCSRCTTPPSAPWRTPAPARGRTCSSARRSA